MAGFFPDIPGHKFDYEIDGTVMFSIRADSSFIEYIGEGDRARMNLVNRRAYNRLGNTSGFTFVFPEERDVTGLYWGYSDSSSSGLYVSWSSDTTDGLDGTWTERVWLEKIQGDVQGDHGGSQGPYPRKYIVPVVGASGIRGLRVNSGNNYTDDLFVHIYGFRTQSVSRLAFWHPTLDEEISPGYLDFGDIYYPKDLPIKELRVKNLSLTKDAEDIVVSTHVLGDFPNARLSNSFRFSTDGINFTPNLDEATFYSSVEKGAWSTSASDGSANTSRAIDSSTSTEWVSNTSPGPHSKGIVFKIDFGSEIDIYGVRLVALDNSTSRSDTSLSPLFYVSDTGIFSGEEELVHSGQFSIAVLGTPIDNSFIFGSKVSSRYLGIRSAASFGGSRWRIGEIDIFKGPGPFLNLGTLGPGEISPVFYVKFEPSPALELGPKWVTLKAGANWT